MKLVNTLPQYLSAGGNYPEGTRECGWGTEAPGGKGKMRNKVGEDNADWSLVSLRDQF